MKIKKYVEVSTIVIEGKKNKQPLIRSAKSTCKTALLPKRIQIMYLISFHPQLFNAAIGHAEFYKLIRFET